mmetsp:Transcript_134164/g.261288  ORF Transcript_134164/g.261288 Transcript_134164/m.261288 type:complete len:214 (-) Transcript_134164:429-1070(-)
MLEDCIGHPEVALSVLKINWVDLVRHCAGSDLSSHYLLLEVIHRNVGPDVAAQVQQDRVDALNSVEDGPHVVVVLNLRCVLLSLQAKLVLAKSVSKRSPINTGICHQMCIHVASGSSKLAAMRNLPKEFLLRLQALNEYLEFLGKVSWRGGLSMCSRQHWHIQFRKFAFECLHKLVQAWDVSLFHGVLQQQGNRGVVDVLTSEREVHIFLVLL